MRFSRGLPLRWGVAVIGFLCFFLSVAKPASVAEPLPHQLYHAVVLNGGITGSAFAITDEIAVTNAHVLTGREAGEFVSLLTPQSAQIAAQIIALSDQMDLAILSVADAGLRIPRERNGIQIEGDPIYAIGFAEISGSSYLPFVAPGAVTSSTLFLEPFGEGIIATMPLVRKGFSGGPVFNESGALIGMVAALRDTAISGNRQREAFILSIEAIHAEVARLASLQ